MIRARKHIKSYAYTLDLGELEIKYLCHLLGHSNANEKLDLIKQDPDGVKFLKSHKDVDFAHMGYKLYHFIHEILTGENDIVKDQD